MLPLYAAIAWRNLVRNRRRSSLAFAALVLGVAVMIAVNGFVNAVIDAQLMSLINGGTGALQVHERRYLKNIYGNPLDLNMPDSQEIRQKILGIEGVTGVGARIVFGSLVSLPETGAPGEKTGFAFLNLTALEPEAERVVSPQLMHWTIGRFLEAGQNQRQMILNEDIAKSLGFLDEHKKIPVSDEAHWPTLISQDKEGSTNGAIAEPIGAMRSALPTDKRVGWVPLGLAQELLRLPGRVTEYVVSVKDLNELPRIKSLMQKALGDEYAVSTWDEIAPFMKSVVTTQSVVFSVVTLIFLLVALLGVVNTMLMSVFERVREIGTLIAVGATRSQVRILFVAEGAFLGFLGSVVGLVVGLTAVIVMNKVGFDISAPGSDVARTLRPFVFPGAVLRVGLIGTLGSALVSLWPAHRAAALRPVDALQTP